MYSCFTAKRLPWGWGALLLNYITGDSQGGERLSGRTGIFVYMES